METRGRAAGVGKLDLDGLRAEWAQRGRQLAKALGVGAVAASNRQGVVVEPHQVAALGGGLILEGGEDRHAEILEGRGDGRLFTAPLSLAHAQHDGAGIGDDDRIVGEDRVGVFRQRSVVEDHLATEILERRDQCFMFGPRPGQVGPGRVVPVVGSALPKAASGRRTRTRLSSSTMLWEPYVFMVLRPLRVASGGRGRW